MTIVKSLKKSLIIFPLAASILFSPIGVQAQLGDTVLKEGVTHEDVQVLQERLIELNFLDIDETNTYYDELTIQAVKDFQNFYGLEEDGSFGPDTFQAMEDVSKIQALEVDRPLELGLKGEDVKDLQERLKIMGFLGTDDVDSSYGPKTRQAVCIFQEVYKLEIDGTAGPATIEAINNSLSGKKRVRVPAASRGGLTRAIDNDLIATARKYIGIPYRSGGTSPKGFDCSGFVQYVYKQHGISVPRSSSGQAAWGTKLTKDQLRTGDLVIFSNTYRKGPSHTGIYVGNGNVIHSSSSRGITIDSINSGYYLKHYSYGRRVY